MFKPARWRSEKNKITTVFKLQFHASQLRQLEADALTISVIPADIGKPTARLEKAKVRDGSCHWEKPLYETVKFSQDPKTGKFHEKIYHFVVQMGSSKFGAVGEVSIDFACYVEFIKISCLSLPLESANSSAILHVSIQRVDGSLDPREADRSENASYKDRSLRAHFSNNELDHEPSSGSDIMLSSSGSSSGLDTPLEHYPKNTNPIHGPSSKIKRSTQRDWLNDSVPKLSTDDSSIGEISEEGSSDIIIEKLKNEIVVLTKQAGITELELQTLRKQIVKERKKRQNHEEVKVNGMLLIDEGDPWALLQELRQELNLEKDLSAHLQLQLQESLGSKSKSRYSNARGLYEFGSKSERDDDDDQRALELIVREHSGTKEACFLERKIMDLFGEIEFYKREKDDLEMQMEQMALDYKILKQENHDLRYKLERSQLQEQLKIQYECTPINDLETQIESLENELNTKSEELTELEAHVKNLEIDLENQARGFESDLEELTIAKTEMERRAIRAEENLRKMRLQNANAAERLQEDLRRLSTKIASTFEANEKAAMEAMDEARKLRFEKRVLEDTLVKVEENLQSLGACYEEKLVFLSNRISYKSKQLEKMKKWIEDMIGEYERQKRIKKFETEWNLEGERMTESGFDSSENLFLEKEKDLQLEIEEFERRLDILVLKTENSQVSMAENSKPAMKKPIQTGQIDKILTFIEGNGVVKEAKNVNGSRIEGNT